MVAINKANALAVASRGKTNNVVIAATFPDVISPVISGSAISSSRIDLSWNFGAYVEYYKLERKITGGSWSTLAASLTAYSYSDVNCAESTQYQYRLTAYNSDSSAVSNTVIISSQAAGYVILKIINELETIISGMTIAGGYSQDLTSAKVIAFDNFDVINQLKSNMPIVVVNYFAESGKFMAQREMECSGDIVITGYLPKTTNTDSASRTNREAMIKFGKDLKKVCYTIHDRVQSGVFACPKFNALIGELRMEYWQSYFDNYDMVLCQIPIDYDESDVGK